LLVKRRQPFPLAPRLFKPHPPAHDFRNRKPRPQLVEELRRKAHEIGRLIRWISQYSAVGHARSPAADCPSYPQGPLEQRLIALFLRSSRRGGQASWQPKAQALLERASIQEVGERDVLRDDPRGVDENSLLIAFAAFLRARDQFVDLGIKLLAREQPRLDGTLELALQHVEVPAVDDDLIHLRPARRIELASRQRDAGRA